MKAVIISGFINGISDNIKTFIDKDTDIFIHTWKSEDSDRWVNKVKRYSKFCNNLIIEVEEQKFNKKLHSYFYSTYRAVSLIENLDNYSKIIKFKPNLQGKIEYKGDIDKYFTKAYIQSKPLLLSVDKYKCIYGSIYYKTLDERIFTATPNSIRNSFYLPFDVFKYQMESLDLELCHKFGNDYEGSIFWKEWFERRDIKLIQDIDLKIPNSLPYGK